MAVKMIDLSVLFDPELCEPMPVKIDYVKHEDTVTLATQAFNLEEGEWPGAKAWAMETVELNTHAGTHVDAPLHYWNKTGDKPARTIDEMPLEWFYGDGVKLDFSWKDDGAEITEQDIRDELNRIGHTLNPGEIVLIYTNRDKLAYDESYTISHPALNAEATRFLINSGIKVMGTDGYGWDIPFYLSGEKYRRTGDVNVLWEAHYVGKELEYCHIEKLANLDQIPCPTGFKVVAFPIKLKGASAGWVRPVAIIEK